jgi:hypothetical protein
MKTEINCDSMLLHRSDKKFQKYSSIDFIVIFIFYQL